MNEFLIQLQLGAEQKVSMSSYKKMNKTELFIDKEQIAIGNWKATSHLEMIDPYDKNSVWESLTKSDVWYQKVLIHQCLASA